ncbi:hypothetical protein HTIA_1545 [Halorhabdus tiamatea SARL4B]|uniref:Uncharacterized protein n=1 Tax=Halorhabdus tiamatea SARL4B TaxID=1033806 RepID=S6CU95_9EURY|nr:hypothetical protein HTIA_1545 [Halorhabdus tiamatea SARL4B]
MGHCVLRRAPPEKSRGIHATTFLLRRGRFANPTRKKLDQKRPAREPKARSQRNAVFDGVCLLRSLGQPHQ